ncbi:MAG: serine hydrolase [Janthinobacterium lividum]
MKSLFRPTRYRLLPLASMLLPGLASAQTTLAHRPSAAALTIQQLGAAFAQEKPHVGLSIGIIQDGRTYFYNFGTTVKDRQQLPTAQTRYEIASISKTFTSLLLAQAVVEGKVQLTDDIRRYLPGSYPNLAFQGHPIRLVDLASTTSGLPDNLPESSQVVQGAPPDSIPFRLLRSTQGYTTARLYAYLHTITLTTRPGAAPQHSNVAAYLLGCLLENVYHRPYAQLLRQHLERPLGLPDGLASAGVATGYNERGLAMPLLGDASPTQVAAGLKYGTADLLKYLHYQLTEQDAAVRLSHQAAWGSLADQAIGLNWNLDQTVDSQRRLWASGGAFGAASYCEFYPGLRLGLVLLANESDPSTQDQLQGLARQLVVALYGVPPALQALESQLQAGGFQHAFTVVQEVKKQHPELHLTESYVNNWGYALARRHQLQSALALFKLNVQLFPNGWNTYDSLAETYELLGNHTLAIKNCQRSIALNPQNANGVTQLQKLMEATQQH